MTIRVIDAPTVARTIPPAALVEPLRCAFADPATAPQRTAHDIAGAGTLLTMPAWRAGGALGIKLATIFPGNTALGRPSVAASYILMSAATGAPRALIDGTALTEARTATISLLGRTLIADGPRRTMLMVGAGALAPHLIRAHATDRVLIWNRTAAGATALAGDLRAQGLSVEAVTNLEAAVRDADLICCATLSQTPLIRGAWLRDGAHLDLVGGYRPDMREADNAAMAAGGLAVDTSIAFDEAGDLIDPAAARMINRATTPDLAALIAGSRPTTGRISVFKSVGTAIADLAAAEELMRRLDNPEERSK